MVCAPTPAHLVLSLCLGFGFLSPAFCQTPAEPRPTPILPEAIQPQTPLLIPSPPEVEIPALVLGDSAATQADEIPWKFQSYSMFAQAREIGPFLAEFGRVQGIKIVVSPGVTGMVSGKFDNIQPGKLLDQFARAYNFSWFYYGGVLNVTSNTELKTEVVNLASSNPSVAMQNIATLGLLTSDGTINVVPDSRIVVVSGPPQFVDLVKQILVTVDSEDVQKQRSENVIEVFPLKHAWAYDIDLGDATGSTEGRIEGVATTLSKLVGGNSSGTSRNFNTFGRPRNVPGVPGQNNSNQPNGSTIIINQNEPGNQQKEEPEGQQTRSPVRITADVRRNAVVIRDVRENMGFYRDAIAKLDVPVQIVEISAAIVDVRIGSSQSLGLNTVGVTGPRAIGLSSATGAIDNTTTNSNNVDQSLTGGQTQSIAPTSGPQPNIVATGVFGTVQVTAAINALEEDNVARVLSRPTVMTLDNYGAVISRQETFYVNSTGQYVSNLFNVTTGLNLQVVPHIIQEGEHPKIYLQVKIEDGSLSNEQVSNIPQVQQSSLTTQSVIKKDQSLLIGGLYVKVNQKQRSGYPWLRQIPVLGYLFGVQGRSEDMVERLFVITPRVVALDSPALGDYREYFKPSPSVEKAIRKALPVDPKSVIRVPEPKPTQKKVPMRGGSGYRN